MPQVTVYIREDDIDLWRAVEKKSEFIHNALGEQPIKMAYDPVTQTVAGKPIKDVLEPKKDAFDALKQTFGVTLCKHGASPGLCKHAKVVNGKKVCK